MHTAKNTDAVKKQTLMAEGLATDTYTVYAKRAQYEQTLSSNVRKYGKHYGHALDPNMWSDGNMFICSNHEHPEDVIGNIYESSFLEIWNGEKRRRRIERYTWQSVPEVADATP